MKRYDLFYQPKSLGDVLLVIIEPNQLPTHSQRIADTVLIYHDDSLIGVNVFNIQSLIKIHASGLIVNPPQVLIDIINDKFANDGVDVYLPKFTSNFIIGEVTAIDYATKQAQISDGSNRFCADVTNLMVSVGQRLVIALDGTLLPNGIVYVSEDHDNVFICPASMFDVMGAPDCPLTVAEKYSLGSEYFHWE
ncbi:MAG TPA: hypothetical protein PK340_06545 [Bacilli bacterium]|mgnify:CR=1 FL=1|nr:hypothetical protein [Bacilli bacterium]